MLGDAAVEKYRLLAVIVGLIIFASLILILTRTKIGLLIRAGVENREMVEALGYRIKQLFIGVFMAGSALAGLGGVMWALYREQVHASMGGELMVLVFIVIIIGGLGSVTGCFIGAILVALVANYAGFLVPKLALVSDILLMVAVLLWRPRGLFPVTSPMMILSGDKPRSSYPVDHPARDLPRARLGAVPVSRLEAAERRGENLHLRAARRELRSASRLYRHRFFRAHDVLRHRRLRRRARAVQLRCDLEHDRARHHRRAAGRRAARPGDRPLLAARAGDLLLDGDARRRLGLRRAGLAIIMADGRRGRPLLPGAPASCARAIACSTAEIFGVAFNGRVVSYYLVFVACVLLFLLLLRIVNSPFGRVLQAIRENPFRAEALGYRIVVHRTLANVIAALIAAAAGALNAIWLHYTGPETSLSFSIMLDILVMVVIGGMGTMYGAVIGAVLYILAQNYLQTLMGNVSNAAASAGVPLVPGLFHPDRWLLWLGILFILSVRFFPTGIVGRLRQGAAKS